MNVATRADAATPRGCKTRMLLTAEILIFDLVTRKWGEKRKREKEETRETESSGYTGAEITATKSRKREKDKDSY